MECDSLPSNFRLMLSLTNQLITDRFTSRWNGSNTELASFQNDLMMLVYNLESFDAKQFDRYPLSLVLHYLKESHNYYREYFMPKMEQSIASLKNSRPQSQAVFVLELFYKSYRNEFLEHIELEERRLFPYAKSLMMGDDPFQSYSVKLFNQQHDHEIENQLEAIVSLMQVEYPDLSQDFAFRSFKNLLEAFQLDIEMHHHVEENVFLKRIAALEKQF
jgi:regulator of cell morphogenesis and NO signaling